MDEITKELEGIRRAVERQGDIAQKTQEVIQKPEGRFSRSLKTFALMVGALGFIHTADVIRRWIIGG